MLILPIKKNWFDMILSGAKKEEYRDIKPYYTTRFINAGFLKAVIDPVDNVKEIIPGESGWIVFRNGYSVLSPSFKALCFIEIKTGNPEWGAEQGKKYYALRILKIERDR